MSDEISLKDLLDTTFSINDKGEMVGEFTLKRINVIGDILTQQNEEIERLQNIIEKNKYTADELNEIERLNKEVDKYKKRCYEALTLIRENYGLLDKYGIDMLDDILNGK